MVRKFCFVFAGFIFCASLAGCATMRRENDLENQRLRNQIAVLEAQIQAKDEELDNLKSTLVLSQDKQMRKKGSAIEAKSRPNARQIQTALANAGYDPGRIDGRLGRKTREAIRAFQRANNLSADGKVGKETWALLRQYLDKRLK